MRKEAKIITPLQKHQESAVDAYLAHRAKEKAALFNSIRDTLK